EIFKMEKGGPPVSLCKAAKHPVAPELEAAIHSCLSFDRKARPASAEALDALLAACPVDAPWTPAEARAWWKDRGARALEAARPGPGERESGHAVFLATEGLGS